MLVTWGALADALARPTAPAALEQISGEVEDGTARMLRLLSEAQLQFVSRKVGMSIPAFRAAHAAITKRPGTWPLRMWQGDRLAASQPSWLANPDQRITFTQLIAETLDDAIWHDRAYWAVTTRGADLYPLTFRRVPAERVTDDERGLLIDGKKPHEAMDLASPVLLADGRILESLIPMRWSGLGGMRGAGRVIVDLALSLMATATNQAKVPLPMTVLVDEGGREMTQTEIDELILEWETKRQKRSTAYVRKIKPESMGYTAKELQLVEAREHVALEVARAFSLPASAVQASNGASLEYSTVVENRREAVEANRLWNAPIEQALSLHAAPRGRDVRFDVTSYLRDDVSTRMLAWSVAKQYSILTDAEIRSQEPLATEGTP